MILTCIEAAMSLGLSEPLASRASLGWPLTPAVRWRSPPLAAVSWAGQGMPTGREAATSKGLFCLNFPGMWIPSSGSLSASSLSSSLGLRAAGDLLAASTSGVRRDSLQAAVRLYLRPHPEWTCHHQPGWADHHHGPPPPAPGDPGPAPAPLSPSGTLPDVYRGRPGRRSSGRWTGCEGCLTGRPQHSAYKYWWSVSGLEVKTVTSDDPGPQGCVQGTGGQHQSLRYC